MTPEQQEAQWAEYLTAMEAGREDAEAQDAYELTPEAAAFEQMGWNMSTYEEEMLDELGIEEDLTEVTVSNIPQCQFCSAPAAYDAKTHMGPWAYLCEKCFKWHGIGLGLGKGQRLVRKEE